MKRYVIRFISSDNEEYFWITTSKERAEEEFRKIVEEEFARLDVDTDENDNTIDDCVKYWHCYLFDNTYIEISDDVIDLDE